MISKIKSAISNLFNSEDEKVAQENKNLELRQKALNAMGAVASSKVAKSVNPFLKSNGELVNPNLNYQQLLNGSKVSQRVKDYITQATGLTPAQRVTRTASSQIKQEPTKGLYDGPINNANADTNKFGDMDIINELPKLTQNQIKEIISKHYKNSTVISPDDAEAIYNAQANSGVSALVTLGIGALESGWGTSNIAQKTRNLWGYGATNDNPEGNAHKYTTMEDAALRYSNSLKRDYYNGYGAKSINSIGTGNNPAGKGYAYNNDGSISTTWSPTVTSIMKTLYNTAQTVK